MDNAPTVYAPKQEPLLERMKSSTNVCRIGITLGVILVLFLVWVYFYLLQERFHDPNDYSAQTKALLAYHEITDPLSSSRLFQNGEAFYSSDPGRHIKECFYTSDPDRHFKENFYTADPGRRRQECFYTADPGRRRQECFYTADPGRRRQECFYTADPGRRRQECLETKEENPKLVAMLYR